MVANSCLRNLPPDVVGPSGAVEHKGDQWGSYPEHAWLIPDSLADSSGDRQTRAQPVVDPCLVVLPTKELVVLCLCRSVFVLGYGVAMSCCHDRIILLMTLQEGVHLTQAELCILTLEG